MTIPPDLKNPGSACDRETELRMEIVAAMRIRDRLRPVARRQPLSCHASGGSAHSDAAGLSRHPIRHDSNSVDSGGHATRILIVSDYDGLRSSCERLLRKNGYSVDSMSSHSCLAAPILPKFDIAVLCQSVEFARVNQLRHLLRDRYPGCSLLRVASLLSGIETGFDLRIDGFGGPAAFLAAIESLVRSSRKLD